MVTQRSPGGTVQFSSDVHVDMQDILISAVMLPPDPQTDHPALYHTKLTCYCLWKRHFNHTSLEYLKLLGPERYKITYAAPVVPVLCMYVKILIATLAEYCPEFQYSIFKSI